LSSDGQSTSEGITVDDLAGAAGTTVTVRREELLELLEELTATRALLARLGAKTVARRAAG
jgi:hypothetical protein